MNTAYYTRYTARWALSASCRLWVDRKSARRGDAQPTWQSLKEILSKNGWKEYKAGEHGEYCKGKGEIAASARYFYQGPEQKSNCLAKCKALGDLCKCCDVGFISDGPPGNMCHFQNKSKDAAPAIHGMEHIKAYVPCKKGG